MQRDLLCGGSQLSDGFSDSNIRRRKRTWNIHRSRMFNKIHSLILDTAYQSVINLKHDRINYIPFTIFDYVTNTCFCFAHFRLLHLYTSKAVHSYPYPLVAQELVDSPNEKPYSQKMLLFMGC